MQQNKMWKSLRGWNTFARSWACPVSLGFCAVWWEREEKQKAQGIGVLDHFSVRAHDSVWTRNLHPRQQSGFHRRVIAVKPPLTGWCGSQRLVRLYIMKSKVSEDSILATALLRWDFFFFISLSDLFFFFFPSFPIPPPLFLIFIVFLSASLSSAGAGRPCENVTVVSRQVFLAQRCLHVKCELIRCNLLLKPCF